MLQLRIAPKDGFFLADVSGLVSVDAWEKVLIELEAAIDDSQNHRLVVDLKGLVGWLGAFERTTVGALMALHLAKMTKVALLIQPEKIVGVVEAEARRRGLDLRIFTGSRDAIAWAVS